MEAASDRFILVSKHLLKSPLNDSPLSSGMEQPELVLQTTKEDYDSDLLYLGFSEKWMLLLVSLVFLVVTIMVFIMSVKTRKQVDSDCTFYYLSINKDQSVVFPKGQVRDGIYFKTIFLDFLCLTCLSK